VSKESDIDAVLLSLVVTGNGLVSAEHILLELINRSLGPNFVVGICSQSSGEGLSWGDILWPVQLSVVYINHNMKIIKEIPSNNHIVRAQLYDKHQKVVDLAAINL
jgi:hypothetical protein